MTPKEHVGTVCTAELLTLRKAVQDLTNVNDKYKKALTDIISIACEDMYGAEQCGRIADEALGPYKPIEEL